LRELNIGSAVNAGRDILGKFYEEFLKYANDANEHGIVFTPRHITRFAAQVVDVQQSDVVFDPACGTGGFLVAALDKVIEDGGNTDKFKTSNIYGIEQDASIAALAIVNMIFRGDGSSNIFEGDGLELSLNELRPTKVLMNPPFGLDEDYEHKFVDRALDDMQRGGLLFAVLPRSVMNSKQNERGGAVWRANLLKQHTLVAVIQLPLMLFYPNANVGTYAVVIKAHRPHQLTDDIVWAALDDGIVRSKLEKPATKAGNLQQVRDAVRNFVTSGSVTRSVSEKIECQPMDLKPTSDRDKASAESSFHERIANLAPEHYIGRERSDSEINLHEILQSATNGSEITKQRENPQSQAIRLQNTKPVLLKDIIATYEKGASGRNKTLNPGNVPLISCAETQNGISAFVDASKTYPKGSVTISSNGGCCYAAYHDYEFAANPDVWVITFKPPYNQEPLSIFMCAAINAEKWRFDYARKFNQEALRTLLVHLPVDQQGNIDHQRIEDIYQKLTSNSPKNAH